MTKRYFSTDTFKKIFHSEKHSLSLSRFKHPTVARQIHTELLFLDCWEAANSIYALTTSRGCHAVLEFWILGYMSGLPHSAATTKALSCLLAPGRDNTEPFESISYGFSTVSLSIVPFVIDLCSFRVWQVLPPAPYGVIYWRQGLNANMHVCDPFSSGARGCSDDVCGEMRKTSITFSFLPPLHYRSKEAAAQSQREKFHSTLCRERWDSAPVFGRAVSICQCCSVWNASQPSAKIVVDIVRVTGTVNSWVFLCFFHWTKNSQFEPFYMVFWSGPLWNVLFMLPSHYLNSI